MKQSHDYDATFQSLKSRHQRLFIAVINECFGKHYPLDSKVTTLPSRSTFHNPEKADSEGNLEERESDFLLCVCGDYYLLECQTYDDGSMSLRLAEYTFLAARSIAQNTGMYEQGYISLPLPHFTVIYVKNTPQTPRTTIIELQFPNGESYAYSSENVFLTDLTKEEIIQKKLFVYIPFYIARYEKELKSEKDYEKAIKDLEYFRDEMLKSEYRNELDNLEVDDLIHCVNNIVTHITDGNKIEKEVTAVMGGKVYELHSDRIIREATEPLKKELEEKEQQLADKDSLLADKDNQLADNQKALAYKDNQLADNQKALADKDQQIAALKAEIETLRKTQIG